MARPPSPDGYPTLCLALLGESPAHGYDLVQRLAERSANALELPAGLIYSILHDLEGQGLVEAEWADGPSGRRRRVYHLTARGRRVLAQRRREWERHRAAVDRVLLRGREAEAGV